jgi:hypothetical protein
MNISSHRRTPIIAYTPSYFICAIVSDNDIQIESSVGDPDPQDPHVFVPSGSLPVLVKMLSEPK